MSRVDLPSGGWAELREPKGITNGQRKTVTRAWESSEGGDIQKAMDGVDAIIRLLVTSWSFDTTIPADNPAALDDLLAVDYDALFAVAKDAMTSLFPNFDVDPDQGSPT